MPQRQQRKLGSRMRRRKRAAVSLSSLLVSFWGLQNDRQVTTTTVAFSSARPVRPQSARHVTTAVAFSSLRPAAKQRGRLTVSCRRQANSPATLQLLSARQELLPRRFGSREGRVIGFRRKLSESPTDVKHGDEFPGDDQEIAWKDDDVEDLTDNLLVEEDESSMGAWVPVGSISCMEGLDPLPVEIMGRQFVVWRGADGRWSVLKDECPHRMVPLSQGRVDPETGCLECAFHGWQFGTEGTLVRIPHLEAGGDLHAESRSVEAFATHVTGDLLWTFLPTLYHGESFPRAVLPEDYYHGLQSFVDSRATYHTQEMPFSFDFLIENGVDGPAHSYFAHNALGFRREEAGPLPVRIPVSNFTELITEVSYRRQGVERRRRYGFQRPFMLMNQQPTRRGDWKTAIIFFAVPIREGFTRVISTFDTLRPHPLTPDWVVHIINKKFYDGDMMVHGAEISIRQKQLAAAQVQPKYIYATSSDTSVRAWRSWWTKYGLSAAPPHTFGPASPANLRLMDRYELSDAWRHHARSCAKCRGALRRIRLVGRAGTTVAWAALALFRKNCVLACVLGLLGAAAKWVATWLARELEGPSSRSEVLDRSISVSL